MYIPIYILLTSFAREGRSLYIRIFRRQDDSLEISNRASDTVHGLNADFLGILQEEIGSCVAARAGLRTSLQYSFLCRLGRSPSGARRGAGALSRRRAQLGAFKAGRSRRNFQISI
ncbi:hypothetical protein TcasGA2_TC000908 [Tribolium castaneum]|uniref:Uncharacterized protein n=1 Tax=Tribolium castaneum TaxID=7070 RepID=D6W926_TRICA|nr:hypothetical protein TcasGA2_TC000908 [Tribolium castaneum]